MDNNIQIITIIVILLAWAFSLLATVVIRRRDSAFPLRTLPAYEVVPRMTGLAIEAGTPILLSTGGATLGNDNTVVALAGSELAYQITREVALGNNAPVFVTSEGSMVPLGYDLLRRAYQSRDLPVRSGFGSVRWYPSGPRSLVFAAMLTATIHSDEIVGAALVGNFGAELALALAAADRNNLPTLAGSDDITGQAIAYAMADGALIGEEIFTAGAYLGNEASHRGTLVAQDLLRGLVIFSIAFVAATQLAPNAISRVLTPIADLFNRFGG